MRAHRSFALRAAGLAAGAALVTSACGYSWQNEVRQRASYQHDCPESDIQIISDNGNRLARQARLEVCGRTRVYEHVNAGASYEWRDVTSGDEAPAAAGPASNEAAPSQ